MEQNRLEAQRRRKESQREAASTLQALTMQQQEQVRKLQEHVVYNQLRHDTAFKAMYVTFQQGTIPNAQQSQV
jgi:membrane protein required for beta-lactamase induction